MAYKLTARVGPEVRKEKFGSLEELLAALEARIGRVDRKPAASAFGREYEPARQVAGRFDIRGPRVRGGVDVRGDGSAEAYTGSIRKVPVEQEPGESAVDALRRALG